ncbi:MAG TPA: FkbM family methyltransferase [Bacteroidia bacterium]|nr:FkbM family methyltransferase [Bacteroidia bacterium]
MELRLKTKIFNFIRNFFKHEILEKYLIKKTRNKSINNFWSKLVPNNYQYKHPTWRKINKNGILMEVDISDYIGHHLYYGFKDDSLNALLNLVKEGQIVMDIGANIGSTSLFIAQKIGSTGKVFSFEPDKYNFIQLSKNISLNKFKNIEIFNYGLGNIKGEFKLYISTTDNRGGNRIIADTNYNNKEYSIIHVERLDDFVEKNNISKIDLIKIDVEGYEYNVLIGAEKVIRKNKPVLFIELDDNNLKQQGHSASLLISFLEKNNYRIVNSLTNKTISSTDNFNNCHYDIIAYTQN